MKFLPYAVEIATSKQLFICVEVEFKRLGILQCSQGSPELELQTVDSTAHPRWKVCYPDPPVSTYCISALLSLKIHRNMNLEFLDPLCSSELQDQIPCLLLTA